MDKFTLKKLPSFSVVGIEGSSHDGPDFVAQLWDKAEKKIADVLPSLKIRNIFPIYWGLMSDNSRSFKPWENDFSEGIYLAGFELADDRLIPPEGWSKWDVPAQTYFVLPLDGDYKETLHQGLKTIQANGYVLSAAIFDHGVCKINDVSWTAIAQNDKDKIPAGSTVEVLAVSGNKLIVKKVENTEGEKEQ